MKDAVTPNGKVWEWRNSLWMLWLGFPFGITSFISFFYIGARVKKKKWIISGFIYSIITVIFFLISEYFPIDHIMYDLGLIVVLAGWIAAWIQAVGSRKEYLVQLYLRQQKEKERYERLLQRGTNRSQPVLEETSVHPAINSSTAKPNRQDKKHSMKRKDLGAFREKEPAVVNMNTASEEEIAAIPSIGAIVAKQIVAVRDRVGDFESFQHFVKETGMKPHILAKAKPYMRFSDVVQEGEDDSKNIRPAGDNQFDAGRIVDY